MLASAVVHVYAALRCWHTCICVCTAAPSVNSYLEDVGKSGESAAEFLALYKKLVAENDCKYYLAIKGVLMKLGTLITRVSALVTDSACVVINYIIY